MKPVIRPSTWRRRARSKGALTAKVGETVRLFLVDHSYFRGHEKGTIGAPGRQRSGRPCGVQRVNRKRAGGSLRPEVRSPQAAGNGQPSHSHTPRPITQSRSSPASQGSSLVNRSMHSR